VLRSDTHRARERPAQAGPPEAPLPVHARDTARADPEAWRDAIRLYRDGDYEDAVLAFSLIARVGPQRQRALVAHASALMNIGRFASAIDLLYQALARDPSDAIASMNLATAQFCARLLPEALAHACASVELFRMADLNIARPRHLQGLIYLETGRLDRARRVLNDALTAEPTFVPAVLALAQCAAAEGDLDEARRLIGRARCLLKRAPDEVRAVSADAVERFAGELPGGAFRRAHGWLRRLTRLARGRKMASDPFASGGQTPFSDEREMS